MGDRTTCILRLHGLINRADASILIEDMERHIAGFVSEEDLVGEIEFDEMNYANMPDEIDEMLCANGVSWDWSWGEGIEYGPGALAHDGLTGTRMEFHEAECGNLLLGCDAETRDGATPEERAFAEAWLSTGRKGLTGLHIYETAHEALALVSRGHVSREMFDRHMALKQKSSA